MPDTTVRYKNNTAAAITAPGMLTVEPGAEATSRDGRYLPLASGLTVVIHRKAPWTTIHDAALPVSVTSGLAKYNQLVILNTSGDVVSLIVNGDSSNVRKIQDSRELIINQNREIDKLTITGSGAGSVALYGVL